MRLFNLRTVLEATRLAKIKEISLRSASKIGVRMIEPRKGNVTSVRFQEALPALDQRWVLRKPAY